MVGGISKEVLRVMHNTVGPLKEFFTRNMHGGPFEGSLRVMHDGPFEGSFTRNAWWAL